jgi:hypothetical protein
MMIDVSGVFVGVRVGYFSTTLVSVSPRNLKEGEMSRCRGVGLDQELLETALSLSGSGDVLAREEQKEHN